MNAASTSRATTAPDGKPERAQPAWRRAFPIDWPQDHYVTRRQFTQFTVLTSLAFAFGQFWIAVQNALRRRKGQPPVHAIAFLKDIPVGGFLAFCYPEAADPCLLLRPDAKTLLAYDQKCTHLSCAVIPSMSAGQLTCPCHKGFFDLATGRPLAGPPRRPLSRITLEVRGGLIYATGVELRTI